MRTLGAAEVVTPLTLKQVLDYSKELSDAFAKNEANEPIMVWKNRETGEIADGKKAQVFDKAAQRWRCERIVVPIVDPLPLVPLDGPYVESSPIREEVWERCEADG